MESFLPMRVFSQTGNVLLAALFVLAAAVAVSGAVNMARPQPLWEKATSRLLIGINILFVAGFLWICWFHLQIYQDLPLALPGWAAALLNRQLAAMNSSASYALPLIDPAHPPRYVIPLWIENEKYYFWFMCYSLLMLPVHFRMRHHRLRAALHILLAVQVAILFLAANPFTQPLPRFFSEVGPWFSAGGFAMERFGLFMRLYPKMVFYYNAEYMWLHPPMLFLAYACITLTFVSSVFMLAKREPAIERMGYDYAKLGYFMLTLGMLLGYPWALQAWGPNWWWDPKICSSIMMWAVYSTYLHTRLYANKPAMWYFSSLLGILCFVAMIFTFLASFFFPGEHTFQ